LRHRLLRAECIIVPDLNGATSRKQFATGVCLKSQYRIGEKRMSDLGNTTIGTDFTGRDFELETK